MAGYSAMTASVAGLTERKTAIALSVTGISMSLR
jgi:hypothetical protein